ncbi:hypothetical protein, partial [Moraxella bovis]|uniref:hypothetical protein n=1 Tax=Moraxella bovis TaxID=476 RepID=UPI001B80DBB8
VFLVFVIAYFLDYYLFPMLSSDYKQKAKDISTTINWYVHLLATHQHTRYLSHSVADVGGYGRYSFFDMVDYE